MRIAFTLIILSYLITTPLKGQALKTDKDTMSYSLGVLIANSLKQQGFTDVDITLFSQAVNTVLKGETPLLTPKQCETEVTRISQKTQGSKFANVKAEGEAFLAQNKTRKEVTTTASGLQYEVLKMGDGKKPSATDRVNVHYHGTLITGEVFDSSVERGEPITFGLNQVIKGWTEVVQLMPVGSKFRAYIPYNLAYGERGAGGSIQPYSTLIFDIELLAIE
jgi:FKBP-type peptidyl-prolyl cis-trans isomerase FklB